MAPFSYNRLALIPQDQRQTADRGKGSISLTESDIKQYQIANQQYVTVGNMQNSHVFIFGLLYYI